MVASSAAAGKRRQASPARPAGAVAFTGHPAAIPLGGLPSPAPVVAGAGPSFAPPACPARQPGRPQLPSALRGTGTSRAILEQVTQLAAGEVGARGDG